MTKSSPLPSVALLCGLLSDAEIWRPVAEKLDAVAEVHIVDFRGLDSIEAMVGRVLDLSPTRFAVAGHSMGGRVALQAWRTDRARFTGMALLNTGTHVTALHEHESRGKLVELARVQGMSALADAWLPSMLDADHSPDAEIYARLASMVERDSPEGFAGHVRALLNRPEAASILPTVTVPLLVMSARGDKWSPPAQHEAMQRQAPSAHLEILERAGHMAPFEQPVKVATVLRKWLSQVQLPS